MPSLPAEAVMSEDGPKLNQPVILRQNPLVFAQFILVVAIGLFGALRLSTLFHGIAVLVATLGSIGLLVISLYLTHVWARTFQTLIVNETGLVLKFGTQVQELPWSEMTGLVLAGPTNSGRPTGITVNFGRAQSLVLGGVWSMNTDKLLRLLLDRCQLSTGKLLPVSGENPGDKVYGWLVVVLAVLLLLPILLGVYFIRLSSDHQAVVVHSELPHAPH